LPGQIAACVSPNHTATMYELTFVEIDTSLAVSPSPCDGMFMAGERDARARHVDPGVAGNIGSS